MKQPKPELVTITLRIPKAIHAGAVAKASEELVSLNSLIIRAMQSALAKKVKP